MQEWTSLFRLAVPDKLGMRCLGRPTVRPEPSSNQMNVAFKVGTPVDAWWSDGWWEGVITEGKNSGDGPLQVYFPGMLVAGRICAVIFPFFFLGLSFLMYSFFYFNGEIR